MTIHVNCDIELNAAERTLIEKGATLRQFPAQGREDVFLDVSAVKMTSANDLLVRDVQLPIVCNNHIIAVSDDQLPFRLQPAFDLRHIAYSGKKQNR